MTYTSPEIPHTPASQETNSESQDVITALDYLSELTELRELLEMCLEQNTGCKGKTESIRIRLLIDSYLSQSETCLNEMRVALRRSLENTD